jgi:dihydroxyacetone kinase-like protein
MNEALSRTDFLAMLHGAAANVRSAHARLTQLDSCGGDGDHGTTMVRGMDAMEATVAKSTATDLAGLLQEIGWALMGVDGGAAGPLFGTFFMGMGAPLTGRDAIDGATLAAMFEGGLASLQKRTKAQAGDKTMIDAVLPAVAAARQAADGGGSAAEVLKRAAEGAGQGAASTEQMQAKFGRARNVGAKSLGTADPGATSVALILEGFCQAVSGSN